MKQFRCGLVAGKFLPPHAGHHAVIRDAETLADRVVVVVCDDPLQLPDAQTRASWLQEVHPFADVLIAEDVCTWHRGSLCVDECSSRWVTHLRSMGVSGVDLVCANDPYGSLFAAAWGAELRAIDPGRSAVPISGTEVRRDLRAAWPSLHPVVRAGLFRRVAIVGAESTGTTTLARELAAAIRAPLTGEEGRVASWALAARHGGFANAVWNEQTFVRLVLRQREWEDRTIALAAAVGEVSSLGPWLVADTDALATIIWWQRYLESDSAFIRTYAAGRPAGLYIVTSPDGVPFDDDGLRDGEHLRQRMHDHFVELVQATGRPFAVVAGTKAERVVQAIELMVQVGCETPLLSDGISKPTTWIPNPSS